MSTNLRRAARIGIFIGTGAFFVSSRALFAQTIDGTITPAEYGSPAAAQDTRTHFGNNLSELDAMYTKLKPNGALDVGLTGNLESSGNAVVLLIDSHSGGGVASVDANGYGTLGSIGGQYTDDLGTDTDGSAGVTPTPGGGSIMPKGFNPDYAIEMNSNDGNNGFSYFINVIDLSLANDPPASGPDNRDIFLGSNVNGSNASVTQQYLRDNGLTPQGTITHAFNDSNAAGVNDWNDPTLGDPLSVTTGLELEFSPDFLQANLSSIQMMAFITNNSGDYLSNQFLPGLGGQDNLGGPGAPGFPMLNAQTLGLSTVAVAVPEPASFTGLALLFLGFARRQNRRR